MTTVISVENLSKLITWDKLVQELSHATWKSGGRNTRQTESLAPNWREDHGNRDGEDCGPWRDVSFTVAAGRSARPYGRNGAAKSTFA